MAAPSTSKAAFKAKSLGLTLDTNIPPGDFPLQPPSDDKYSHKGGIFTQLATAPATKVHFSTEVEICKPAASKISEALLSTDWRKDCRQQGPPPTAPAKKVQFSSDEIKPQKPKFDVTAADNYGLRRYRDVPVDPDFIHSAPATKKEFDIVRDEDDYIEDEDEDEDHIFFQSPQHQTTEFKQTSESNLLQLKQLITTPKEIESATTRDSASAAMSPYFMVSPAFGTKGFDLEFPFAEIQAVKHGKRFQTGSWDDLEPAIKQKFSSLEVPRTAGLPVGALRREFQQRQAEAEAEQQKANETTRFNALLEKLQKVRKVTAASGSRRPSIIDIKPSFWTKDSEEKDQQPDNAGQKNTDQRRPSHDSAISGFSVDGDKALTALNPKAPEFCITSPEEPSPKPTVIVSVEQFKEMCARLQKIETELAREKSMHPSHFGHLEPRSSTDNFTLGDLNPDLDLTMVQPLQNNHASPHDQELQPPLPQHVKNYLELHHNGNVPSNPTFYLADQHNPQMNGVQTMPQLAPPAPIQTQQNGVGFQGPSVAFPSIIPSAAPQQAPVYVHNQLAAGSPMYPWNHAAYPSGPYNFAIGISLQDRLQDRYAKMGMPTMTYPLGPKPVRKPRGPPRPDIRQTMHQQEYEAYLEWKRSTNIDYAKGCKNRQARRAERQRFQQA